MAGWAERSQPDGAGPAGLAATLMITPIWSSGGLAPGEKDYTAQQDNTDAYSRWFPL